VKKKLDEAIIVAARKGIRIIPVTCSGIDKGTEFLMRSLALLTNGTYVFLTDDSGVGNPHIKPTTDKYDVELFNDLVQRLIVQYSTVVDCSAEIPEVKQDTLLMQMDIEPEIQDTTARGSHEKTLETNPDPTTNVQPSWKIYPNPTYGMVNIESDKEINTLYLCDVTGKIVKRHLGEGAFQTTLDISELRRGIYFICYEYEKDKWMKGKIILTR
jgi:hypothetical protein